LFFLSIKPLDSELTPLVTLGILVLFIMVILLCGLLFLGPVFLRALTRYADCINFTRWRAGDFIVDKSRETLDFFEKYKKKSWDTHISVIALSLGIWLFTYLLFIIIAISTGIHADIPSTLFASSFALFTLVLPIQGIGGFGTMEGGWALGFITIGMTQDIAIKTGFAFHIMVLMYTIILGFTGWVYMYGIKKGDNTPVP
jgi:uncharacterized membrane protein YbhN (UPF0104 family)